MLTLQKLRGYVQRNLGRPSLGRPCHFMSQRANLQGQDFVLSLEIGQFRDRSKQTQMAPWTQAASVASVSAASGSFEDFCSGGVAADAKSSKFTVGVSTPRAKIWLRSRLRRSNKEGRVAWRRHFGSGR